MEGAIHQRCLIRPEPIPPRATYEKLFENLAPVPSNYTGSGRPPVSKEALFKSIIYRTFSVGFKACQKTQDAIKKANGRQYNAITAIKPGNATADMVKASKSSFIHIHGLGLESYILLPVNTHSGVEKEYPCELKEGMIFAMTAACNDPGPEPYSRLGPTGDGQGVDIEDMVLVTKTGAEVLIRFPSDVLLTVPLQDDQGYEFRSPEDYLREARIRLNLPVGL